MKAIKKGICLLLIALLCVGLFAACDNDNGNGESGDGTSGILLGGIDAHTVVMEVEGNPVLWQEVYYDLQNVRSILEQEGPMADWDEIFHGQPVFDDEELSFNEFTLRFAIDSVLQRRAVEHIFTDELGESLDEDFYETAREEFLLEGGIDEDEFEEFLEEFSLQEEVFRYLNENMAMHERVVAYVETSDSVSAEVAAFIEEQDVLCAKHILISVRDEDDEPLPEDEQEAAGVFARELYEELATLTGDAQIARFEEMLAEDGADPGMMWNPDGYTFAPGAMVEEFTEGTQALEIGEIGPPIRSRFGYHIILRLAVDPSAPIMGLPGDPSAQAMVIQPALMRMIEEMRERLHYEILPILDTIVPSEIFAWGADEDEE